MNTFLFIIFITISSISHASVKIAFIEIRKTNNQLIQLEPGGQYAHIAISFKDKWLHAHPYRGVEIIDQDGLKKMGKIVKTLTITDKPDLFMNEVIRFLGKSYDSYFSWSDDKIYCSELVGKILEIPPRPMSFSTDIWTENFKNSKNSLGLSPDDIYIYLTEKGYNETKSSF